MVEMDDWESIDWEFGDMVDEDELRNDWYHDEHEEFRDAWYYDGTAAPATPREKSSLAAVTPAHGNSAHSIAAVTPTRVK